MKKKKILVICPSPKGENPAQRLKYEQYFTFLEDNGFEITISSFQSKRFSKIIYHPKKFFEKFFWVIFGYLKRVRDLFRIPFYDGIYIFLWVTPLGFPVFERLFTLLNTNIIYDIDDMIFLGDTSKVNKIIAPLKGTRKAFVLMTHSKQIIVCTPKLEEIAKKYNKSVIDISSTFDLTRFTPVKDYKMNPITTIGWTGTHSTLKFLSLIEKTLQNIALKRKIKLIIICDIKPNITGVDVEYIKWSEENEVEDLKKIEIGLYPLPNQEWVLGKSGLKALNYMSIAIPSVSSAIGANFRVVKHNETGYLVNSEEEWENAIIALIDDVNLRKNMGLAARKRVEEHFSVKKNEPKYLKVFNDSYIAD